jgi:hypothetical protein
MEHHTHTGRQECISFLGRSAPEHISVDYAKKDNRDRGMCSIFLKITEVSIAARTKPLQRIVSSGIYPVVYLLYRMTCPGSATGIYNATL